MAERQTAPDGEAMHTIECVAETMITAAQGDLVVALLRVLKRNAELERELARARAAASSGFSRDRRRG